MNDNNNIDRSGFICFIAVIAVVLMACSGVFKDDTHKSSYSYSSSYKPSSYKPSGSSYSSSRSSSHSNNYLDFNPDDYDNPDDFADDAEDYFGDWDRAYDYWENY